MELVMNIDFSKFEDFSNINSEFNLITLKEKLENKNNKKTNKNKLIN